MTIIALVLCTEQMPVPPRDSDEYVSADEFIWYDDFSEAFVRMSMGVFSNNLDWEQVREREREREKERQKKIKRDIYIYIERDRHRDGENRESGLCMINNTDGGKNGTTRERRREE